ncbi:MAG TPA: hypothetical protein VFR15_08675 [Chloroflexia bacterium]|nr:hypothetical protein [Chloroflexia bacterium]
MMDQTGTYRFEYEDVMRALGYFIDQNNLREVCIIELREGILLRGTSFTANRSGYQTLSESYIFTNDDLERIIEESYERRGMTMRRDAGESAGQPQTQPAQGQAGIRPLPAQPPAQGQSQGQGQPPPAPMPPR